MVETPKFSGLMRAAGTRMFHGMSEERDTIEFLGKQLERVIAEQNSTRDDLRGLTTIVEEERMR